ncbi:conserved protein, unknown function [Plasmodium malariae]|uniref:Helicase-associated domain-containing protein n=1 Tax=Plasmodium malariae TaxID=5858 RepID=A0A1A8WAR0_PLAMA|nr:conserved protein, unknown function [Plasmodium malariae]SBS89073.1 conserved Plasmodium protein, unknown function [Plasmodium malariae]SCO94201.1 conserved protein, unknown function [Plasmodium malariae]
MRNYVIFNRDEKKLLFEKFESEILNLLKIHNVFLIAGRLGFDELIKLVLILYEKKFHALNETSKLCLVFSEKIFTNCYHLIEDDSRDFFSFLNDYDNRNVDTKGSNKILVLDESKLLQKILFDPLLIEFNIVILTNIHKRLTKTDLILSLLKKILVKRNDLFIFIFSDFFVENVLNFFDSYNSKLNFNLTASSTSRSIEHERIDLQDAAENNAPILEEGEKSENAHKKSEDSIILFHHLKKENRDDIARREKYREIKREKKERKKYKKGSKSSSSYERMKILNYEKKHNILKNEKEKIIGKLKRQWGTPLEDHIYIKKHARKNSDGDNEQQGNKKSSSIKSKKLKDLLNNKKKYFSRSRSNSLLKDKEIDKVLFLNNCENSIFSDSDMEDQKKLKFKGEKGKGDTLKKKKNALNCFFVNSAKHSLVPDDYKDEIDDFQIIDRKHVNNANYEINKKLEEWKDVVEKLEKINNVISIFIFNILNYSSFNNYEAKQRRTKEFQHNQIYYLKERCSNYLEMSITLIKKLYEDKKRTDQNILIYLNNEYEIDVVKKGLRNKNIESTHIEIIYDAYRDDIDLYELKNKIIIVKDIVFYFYNKFKNVKYMIDTCFMKDKIYDYDLNVTNEFTVLCSKSICEERRLACNSSICFRLITLNDYMDLLDEFPIPEILKKDIFYNIYFLKTIGIKNICSFDFVTAPMLKSLKRCFELFYILKLMDIDGNLIDKKLSLLICYLPLKFKYSIFLLNSIRYKCVGEVSIIISMLINEPIFLYNNKNVNRLKTMRLSLMAEESDILSYYNIFQNFEMAKNKKSFCNDNFLVYRSIKKATKFFIKLKRILHDFGIDMERSNNIEFIFKAKISAFFYNVSKVVKDNKYELLNKRSGPRLFHLDSLSVLNEREEVKRKFIVYTDAYSNNESRIFIRHASIIDPSWLTNVCPSYFSNQHEQKFEEVQT